MRVPLIHGLPTMTSGFTLMRSCFMHTLYTLLKGQSNRDRRLAALPIQAEDDASHMCMLLEGMEDQP